MKVPPVAHVTHAPGDTPTNVVQYWMQSTIRQSLPAVEYSSNPAGNTEIWPARGPCSFDELIGTTSSSPDYSDSCCDDAAENHAHEMGKDALTEGDLYDNLLKKLKPVDPPRRIAQQHNMIRCHDLLCSIPLRSRQSQRRGAPMSVGRTWPCTGTARSYGRRLSTYLPRLRRSSTACSAWRASAKGQT
jgi:hypothetical protein